MISAIEEATRGDSWTTETVLLAVSPVLRHLAEHHLRALIDGGETQELSAGTELVRVGTVTSNLILLVSGTCGVRRGDPEGTFEAPALVGDISCVAGAPHRATVRAIDCARVLVIDRRRVLEAIHTSAAAGQELTEIVADRLCAPDAVPLVGRFAIDGVIGEGGSGRVLRARHPLLGIPIAIKMLSHAHSLSPAGAQAFVREASSLVQLEHPGIVRVLDAFEALETFFMVMPWIEGATLRAHLDGKAEFSPEQILRVADEGLSALSALHAAGLVHRDVKPSNLLINVAGRLVLIDLGIACPSDGAAPERQLVGSPSYSSPEQILARPVDGRSDVYSLGCTLYELIFGRPPFEANDIEQAIDGHLHGTPSFDLAPNVAMGEPFMRWLARCLSRTRAKRPSATTARAALRHLLPSGVVDRPGWHDRPSAAFPVVRETVEWRALRAD